MSVWSSSREQDGIWAPFRSLVGAQGVSVVLGLFFWVLAARVVPASDVGLAAAAISTQTLLGLVASLGVGTHLVTQLPLPGIRRRALLLRGLLVVGVVGALLGVLVAAAVQPIGGALGSALSDPLRVAVFVLGAGVAAVVLVLDEAVLGLRRAPVQMVRNVTASTIRLPLAAALAAIGSLDALLLQLCWALPLVLSLAVAWQRLGLEADRDRVSLRDDLAEHARPALRHHALNLAVAAATQLVPVAGALTLVATDNAVLAIAWLLATVAFLPPYLLTMSLFAHAANAGPDALRRDMRRTLPVSFGLSLVAVAGAWMLGDDVLAVFGGEYADRSYDVLAVLVPAGLWMVVKDHLVTWWRAERRFALATRLAALSVVVEIGAAAAGGLVGGARGLAVGWAGAMALELVVAVPVLWRLLHPRAGATPPPAVPRQRLETATMTPATTPATSADAASRPKVLAVAACCVLLLVGLGLLAAPALDDLRDGPPPASGSTSGSGSSNVPVAADTAARCEPAATSSPQLDLSVKTDTGVPGAPLLAARSVDRLVGLADRAGARVVSTTVSWRTVRPAARGRYDFRGLDRLLAATGQRGLDVRVQLVHTPAWAIDTPGTSEWRPPTTGPELRRWSDFVGDVVRHLDGRARYVEVWTEPNLAATWTTGPDPAAFARLLTVSAAAVARVDPQVTLVSGGLASNDVGYASALVAELGDARPFDLFGVHPWTEAPPSATGLARQGPFGEIDDSFTGYAAVHDVVGRPLYLGEVGYATGSLDDRTRATFARDALDLAACTPYVRAVSWYHLHATPWDPQPWSLIGPNGRPGPTYDALRAWSAQQRTTDTTEGS